VRLAFIVQRYGAEVLGGSEHLCRLVAEQLAEAHEVDVITTCAQDYVTWKNEYPEGADRVRGVTVRRFATSEQRNIEAFNAYSDWIFNNPHTRADELEWLRRQGPWAPGLIEYLKRHQQQYDVLIFFTYLYAPTVIGMDVAPARSILVSTAHDEPAIRLEIFRELFRKPAALCYLTESEQRFVRAQFVDRPLIEDVVGVGVDLPQQRPYPRSPDADRPRREGEPAESTDAATDDAAAREFGSHLLARGSTFRRRLVLL
jgi:hypothetical protein